MKTFQTFVVLASVLTAGFAAPTNSAQLIQYASLDDCKSGKHALSTTTPVPNTPYQIDSSAKFITAKADSRFPSAEFNAYPTWPSDDWPSVDPKAAGFVKNIPQTPCYQLPAESKGILYGFVGN